MCSNPAGVLIFIFFKLISSKTAFFEKLISTFLFQNIAAHILPLSSASDFSGEACIPP
jgi:hypothetical protein